MTAIIAVTLALLLSAFFSGSEIAFVSSNTLRVATKAQSGGFIGRIVNTFVENPGSLLTTTLVGNNLALVIYSTLMAFVLEPPLHHFVETSIGLHGGSAALLVLVFQTVIASLVVLFFGEIIPKSILREVPVRAVFALALPLRIVYYLLLPLVKLAEASSRVVARVFGFNPETASRVLRKDFEIVIQDSISKGELALDDEEQTIIANLLAFDSMKVKESMVPRTDIIAVEESASVDEIRSLLIESGYSKLPVFGENIDSISGIVFARDLFSFPETVAEILKPVHFVPESKPSRDLLRELLDNNISVAVVLDEYGGVSGLITLEDLLEELFGDIQDEFDNDEDIVRKVGDNTYILSGRVEIDELKSKIDVDLPEGDYETVAGLILERSGTIPTSRAEIAIDNLRFTILQSTASRIDLVRLRIAD